PTATTVLSTFPLHDALPISLAGIGSVETSHASIDDSGLNAQGVAEPAMTGPVLDGSEGVMEVEDTDEGEYDDDEQWDLAVGPMQDRKSTRLNSSHVSISYAV